MFPESDRGLPVVSAIGPELVGQALHDEPRPGRERVLGRPRLDRDVGAQRDLEGIVIPADPHRERRRPGLVEEDRRRLRHGEPDLLDQIDRHVDAGRDAGGDVAEHLHESRRGGHLDGDGGGELGHVGDLY
jgi:hypothetical protein